MGYFYLLVSLELVMAIVATVCSGIVIAIILLSFITNFDSATKLPDYFSDGSKVLLKFIVPIGVVCMLIAWVIPPLQGACS